MILGIVTSVIFLFVIILGFIKKKKTIKMHKWLGYLLLVVSIAHLLLSISLWKQRPVVMIILGFLLCITIGVCLFLYKKKKIHILLTIIIGLLLVGHLISGFTSLVSYQKKVKEIVIKEVDMTLVKDGNYVGECNVGYVYARVEVGVSNGQIMTIEVLEHRTEKGKKAEVIIDDIIANQDVDVNVISSATNSSMVIKKAVENALEKGIK